MKLHTRGGESINPKNSANVLLNWMPTKKDNISLQGVRQPEAAGDDAPSAGADVGGAVPAAPARQRLRRAGPAARLPRALRPRRRLELHARQRPLARRLLGHGGRRGGEGDGQGRIQVRSPLPLIVFSGPFSMV